MMTRDEAKLLLSEVISEADHGCSTCVTELCEHFLRVAPKLGLEDLTEEEIQKWAGLERWNFPPAEDPITDCREAAKAIPGKAISDFLEQDHGWLKK